MSYTSGQDAYPVGQAPTGSMYSGAPANMYGAFPPAATGYGADPYATVAAPGRIGVAASRLPSGPGYYYPNYGVGPTAAASRFYPYAQPGNQAAVAASAAYSQGYYGAQNPSFDENASYYGGPYGSGYGRDPLSLLETGSLTGSRYAGSMTGMPRPGYGGYPMPGRRGWPSVYRFNNKYDNNQGMYAAPNSPYANAGEVTISVNARIENDVNLLLDVDIQVVVPASSLARDVWQYARAQSIELSQAGYKPTGEIRLTTETVRGIEIVRLVNVDEPIRQCYRPEYLWVFTVFPATGMPFNGGRMGRVGNGYYGGQYGNYTGQQPNYGGRYGGRYGNGSNCGGGGWLSSLGSAVSGLFGQRYGNSYDGGTSGYPSVGGGGVMPMRRFGLPRSRSVGSLPGMASDVYGGEYAGGYDAPVNGGRAVSFNMM